MSNEGSVSFGQDIDFSPWRATLTLLLAENQTFSLLNNDALSLFLMPSMLFIQMQTHIPFKQVVGSVLVPVQLALSYKNMLFWVYRCSVSKYTVSSWMFNKEHIHLA